MGKNKGDVDDTTATKRDSISKDQKDSNRKSIKETKDVEKKKSKEEESEKDKEDIKLPAIAKQASEKKIKEDGLEANKSKSDKSSLDKTEKVEKSDKEKRRDDSDKKRESMIKSAEKTSGKTSDKADKIDKTDKGTPKEKVEKRKTVSSKSEREDLKSEKSKRSSKETKEVAEKPKERAKEVKSARSRDKEVKKNKEEQLEERVKSPPNQIERRKSSKAENEEVKKTKSRLSSSKDRDIVKDDLKKDEKFRPVSSGLGSPKAALRRPDPAKNKTKPKKSIAKKSMLPLPKKKKKKTVKTESVMLTLSRLSAFLNENSESLFDGPSFQRQTSLTAADLDDVSSMDRDDLEKSYKILKTVIADMERKLIRERERAKAMPKAMSNVPTSLEANMNLRYQYQKALDMERENYVRLEKENQKLAAQMRVIEMKACKIIFTDQLVKFKKAQSLDEQTAHIQEVNVLKNKIKDLDIEKLKESEDHNRTLAQLEKVIKERDKLANEIIQMRRLQIHISHQLAERYTANSEGEAEMDTAERNEYQSGRSATHSAKSTKSVKFSKESTSRKVPENLVKGTAASEARMVAAKEKLREKADEAAALAKLREIKHRRKSSSKIQAEDKEENEKHESAAEDSILGESIPEDEFMIEPEVGEDDEPIQEDHTSYTRSSVSSHFSQSFNQSLNSSAAITAEEK